jgi:hypothetical protein
MPKAKVDSLEVLKSFRAALWKFGETSMAALAEAEGEVHRTMVWLETEQLIYWQNEIRKRHDWVEKCKEAYRQKTLFKDAAGTKSSGFDERKALEKANRALEEAEEKYANVQKYVRILQKELQNFTGSLQRFSTDVSSVLPMTVAKLEKMYGQLEAYVNLSVPQEMTGTAATSPEESMSRGSADAAIESTANQLARHTPPPEERGNGGLVESANFLATPTPVNAPARLAIAMLDVKRIVPEGAQGVAISTDLSRADHLYLHRTAPAEASDSGWFIGPSDRESVTKESVRITVDRLLEVRPDWREILALPVDFMVIITAGIITNVYNQKGADMWTRRP